MRIIPAGEAKLSFRPHLELSTLTFFSPLLLFLVAPGFFLFLNLAGLSWHYDLLPRLRDISRINAKADSLRWVLSNADD